jgi:hypothetical protein
MDKSKLNILETPKRVQGSPKIDLVAADVFKRLKSKLTK